MHNIVVKTRHSHCRPKDSGQAVVLVLLALGLFLVGTAALAVDFTNLWFHKQGAQAAADAACAAGAQERLTNVNDPSFLPSFTPGTDFTCTTTSTESPCWYARENGYSSNGSTPGNTVSVSFPTGTCPGPGISATDPLTNPGTCPAPGVTPAAVSNPFIRVDILERVQVFLTGLLSGTLTQDVRAFAVCGVISEDSTVPIAVLSPTADGSLDIAGTTSHLILAGGSNRSIAVNSTSTSAVTGGGLINIAYGGPGVANPTQYCGGILTVAGAVSATSGFTTTQGDLAGWSVPQPSCAGTLRAPSWRPGGAVPDSLALIPAPTTAGLPTPPQMGTPVGPGTNGCPDPGGCTYYQYGIYTSGISVGRGPGETAIFEPGIYYVTGGLNLNSNSCARPTSGIPGQMVGGVSVGGTMFYFADNNSFQNQATGGKCDFRIIPPYTTADSKCDPVNSQIPSYVKATINDSVFLAPCLYDAMNNFYYGDPLGAMDPLGIQRGIVFFQNRSQTGGIRFRGNPEMLIAGMTYVHRCRTDGVDSGTGCVSPTSPNCTGGGASSSFCSNVDFGGSSGSTTFVIGGIITDMLRVGGSSTLALSLNPGSPYIAYQASIFR